MRKGANLAWFELCWPRQVEPEQLEACFRLLHASAQAPVVLQATGSAGHVRHYLGLNANCASQVRRQLQATLPGLGFKKTDGYVASDPSRAVRLKLSTKRRPLRTDDPGHLSRTLLTALAGVGGKEHVVLQWILGPALAPAVVPSQMPGRHAESWLASLLLAPWQAPAPLDAEARTALKAKQGEPGWRAVGRIAVTATLKPRSRQLISQVLTGLRAGQSAGVRLLAANERPDRVCKARSPWIWPTALNIHETAALSSWPVGETGDLPVRRATSRPLKPSPAIARDGRTIGQSTWPGNERNLALTPQDSLRHLHVLGPTGTGKSTLLLNLITQDMAAGRAVVVIEPKGDLVAEVLRRVPESRTDDVVLLDPTDGERPVGLNPLRATGRSPELAADQLLAVFHGLYAAHWGPRTQDILHASLLTLTRWPDMTLLGLPLLLTDPAFRRKLVAVVGDDLALGPFWAGYEAWSEAERTAAIAPVMNKLRPFILRSNFRRVIGHPTPRFDVRQVFTERKILLVDLNKGRLGQESAALLGSLVVAQLWQATLERSRIAPERRHPVMVFVDEFQDYLHLPTDLGDALASARGLGVGLTLAHQHLHQLHPAMRSAVLANARSRVCFQLGQEDARAMAASGTQLVPEDFQGLGRFQAYASLVAHESAQPWCSLRTRAPGPSISDPKLIKTHSRNAYGTPRQEIEAAIEALVGRRRRTTDVNDLAPRQRSRGGQP